MAKLNLGCGHDYIEGWVNLDFIGVKKDARHDLNKFPYPFKKNTFDEVLAKNVLEHLESPIKALNEIIRISKNNAKITIIVPHAYSYAAITDMQHKTFFTENSFCESLLEEYCLKELVLKRKEFIYTNKWKKLIPFKRIFKIFLNGIYDDLLFEFKANKL